MEWNSARHGNMLILLLEIAPLFRQRQKTDYIKIYVWKIHADTHFWAFNLIIFTDFIEESRERLKLYGPIQKVFLITHPFVLVAGAQYAEV